MEVAIKSRKEAGLPPDFATMWILPLFLAGAAVLFALSPEAAAVVAQKVTGMLPDELKFSSAGSWFDGHQSIGLAYLSGALFFVMRTVSRLVDR